MADHSRGTQHDSQATSAAPACPDESALLAYVQGEAPAGERAALEAHLSRCDDCRSVVSALARTSLAPAPVAAALAEGDEAPASGPARGEAGGPRSARAPAAGRPALPRPGDRVGQ